MRVSFFRRACSAPDPPPGFLAAIPKHSIMSDASPIFKKHRVCIHPNPAFIHYKINSYSRIQDVRNSHLSYISSYYSAHSKGFALSFVITD